MAHFDLEELPHRRYNPLTNEWILVSPHRTKRPWLGHVERVPTERLPQYDPTCYLCPGNERAGGVRNPLYADTFVFDNDFAAVLADTPPGEMDDSGLLVARTDRGVCRVICFTPDHSLTLPQLSVRAIRLVVDTWAEQYEEIGRLSFINYVQIFENKGAMMGSSNPHPHSQVWSNEIVPQQPALECATQLQYRERKGSCLLCDYAALEVRRGERVVCANEQFVAVVPFWAVWPYEIMVVGLGHWGALSDMDEEARDSLADILRRVTIRYDNLFEVSFPYTMGIHQRPTDGEAHPEWHLHVHFYPPLLRSATVRKYMVGYEMLANPQRDLTAEAAAVRLRALAETRFE